MALEDPTATRPPPSIDETIELVCGSGHRTTHLLARILRLNDGWCGKCGADLDYHPVTVAVPHATNDSPVVSILKEERS